VVILGIKKYIAYVLNILSLNLSINKLVNEPILISSISRLISELILINELIIKCGGT
jgi:hypothetical protein